MFNTFSVFLDGKAARKSPPLSFRKTLISPGFVTLTA
jgi:hypothetical protein